MSRRKQSNPRQIKRRLDDGLEEDNDCISEEKEPPHNEDFSMEENLSADFDTENSKDVESPCNKGEEDGSQEEQELDGEGQSVKFRPPPLEPEVWDGPRELEVVHKDRDRRVQSRQPLAVGTTWGPFEGKIETGKDQSIDPRTQCAAPLVMSAGPRWLLDVTWLGAEDSKNNCVVYSKGGQLWCTTTKNIAEGEELVAFAVDFDARLQAGGHMSSLTEGMYPARLLDTIPLLPQQAAMASILPTAIVNKDIFPCKTCGIWYRSERNLQAHLMYYCSGRQMHPQTAVEKSDTSQLQTANICPFPHCSKSFSGPQALEMHLNTHSGVKMEETLPPGTRLKCTICTYTADSIIAFQHHILSHLSRTAFRCNHCHFSFQSQMELVQHQDLHKQGGGAFHRDRDGKQSPRQSDENPPHGKDVLQSPKSAQNKEVNSTTKEDRAEQMTKLSALKGDGNPGGKASFSYPRIKSEPSSPRLASSPVQHNVGPTFPIGPFLSQFPFPQDLPVVPQASEILAKMSELVHRRLQNGMNIYPPLVYSPLMPKGATCFECNITFNNLDNYFVHKKHYCNSRWQDLAKSPDCSGGLDKVTETVSPNSRHSSAAFLNGGHLTEGDNHLMQSACLNLINGSGKVPDKELSGQVKKAFTPTGTEERPNSVQVNANSPNTSQTENDSYPSKTTCEACKITFSRYDNYIVHKQYYCATRHDPPMKRTAANKVSMQRMMRTRKRRKLYEMYVPSQEQGPPQIGPLGFLGVPTLGSPCTTQEAVDNPGNRFHPQCTIFPGMVPKHVEPSLTVSKSALMSKCNTIDQQELDAPIDLSKKCSPNSDKTCQSPTRLLDYHECTVCKIGFNKVEDYLAHKQNFCPVTAPHPEGGGLAQTVFPDMKFECNNPNDAYDNGPVKCDKNASSKAIVKNGCLFPSHSGTVSGLKPADETQPFPLKEENKTLPHCFYPQVLKKLKGSEEILPYYGIKPSDYVNGSLVGQGAQDEQKQSPSEATEEGKDQPTPNGCPHPGKELLPLLPNNRGMMGSINGGHKPEERALGPVISRQESLQCNSQSPDGRPLPAGGTENPSDSNENISPSPKSQTEEAVPAVAIGTNGPAPAVSGSKYCRLCDIQFSSLSNFITHKKFYCLSHAAEHVK
ncbi:zinc finger protein ZFPM2-like isoform X1 [Megalops cyprinoides]|uniref:zinc finger protein ZFPM2-like isoform X1 n=1 Tax=Megalops cyprinoides TaxID=118141 RepID=UPI001863C006|nr:zinc finger protein ZFPM2-like isoform X1 [Megalops cyprinoides]